MTGYTPFPEVTKEPRKWIPTKWGQVMDQWWEEFVERKAKEEGPPGRIPTFKEYSDKLNERAHGFETIVMSTRYELYARRLRTGTFVQKPRWGEHDPFGRKRT